ncbi:hypothetical protein T4B_2558, partial [Trichinella pseudospiralis]
LFELCLVILVYIVVQCLIQLFSTMSSRKRANVQPLAKRRRVASSDAEENKSAEETVERPENQQLGLVDDKGRRRSARLQKIVEEKEIQKLEEEAKKHEELTRTVEEARRAEEARLTVLLERAKQEMNLAEERAKALEEYAKTVEEEAEAADKTAVVVEGEAEKAADEAKRAGEKAKKAQIEAKNAQDEALMAEQNAKTAKKKLMMARQKARERKIEAKKANIKANKAKAEVIRVAGLARIVEEERNAYQEKNDKSSDSKGAEENTEVNVEETVAVDDNTAQAPVLTESDLQDHAANELPPPNNAAEGVNLAPPPVQPEQQNPPEQALNLTNPCLLFFNNIRIITFLVCNMEYALHDA